MVDIVQVGGGFVGPNEAKVNLSWGGQNYDLSNPVPLDITDADLKGVLSEVIRAGGDGIPADQDVGPMANFVVERLGPTARRPHNLIMVQPKTEFG